METRTEGFFWKGVENEVKQKKIQIPMSLVFAKEECIQALLDFLFYTDIGRVSGVEEEADLDCEELSDGGV